MAEDLAEQETEVIDWLVVGVHREEHAMYELQLAYAESVHMHGEPCAWFMNKIIASAPNLKRIRVIPTYAHLMEPEHEIGKLLAERNIEVVVGYIGDRPKSPRKTLVAKTWLNKRYFLLRLVDEQKKLLEEVQRYAPEDWEATSRYLCLNGEKHITLQQLAEERSVSGGYIEIAVGMVLYHLDSPFDVPLASLRKERVLQEKVEKSREEERLAALRFQRLAALGLVVADLPQGMSDDFLESYALIRKGWLRGNLEEYLLAPREREFLIQRYGLRDKQFRTLEEIGTGFNLTRERVRQVERGAIKKLKKFAMLLLPSPPA